MKCIYNKKQVKLVNLYETERKAEDAALIFDVTVHTFQTVLTFLTLFKKKGRMFPSALLNLNRSF